MEKAQALNGLRLKRSRLKREAAVDQERLSSRECGFVAGEIDRHRRDFLGCTEAAHRLSVDEELADLLLRPAKSLGLCCDP